MVQSRMLSNWQTAKWILPILLVTGFFSFGSSVRADTISGFVRDAESRETLVAANVIIQGTSFGAMTNTEGYFVIHNVPTGDVILACTYIGYKPYQQTISFSGEKSLTVEIELEPTALQSEEVVVEAERTESVELVETGTIHVTPRKLQASPVMAEADLMRTLQSLPGVLTLSEFSSGLYVRGGTPDQNLVLLDGVQIYNVNHLFGLFSTFDVEAIKDVKFVRSGFSARYGHRLSSVLDITNKDGNRSGFRGKTSLGLVSTRSTLQGPVGNGAWFFSGRRTYVDYIINGAEQMATGATRDQLEFIPDYYFYDAHFKVSQNLGPQDKLSLTYYSGRDMLNYDQQQFAFSFGWGNQALNARWTHLFSDQLFSNFHLSRSYYHSDLDRDDALFTGKIFNDVADLNLGGDFEYFASGTQTVKAGFEVKRLEAQYDARLNKQEALQTAGSSHLALYIQNEWKVSPLLMVQPGLRVTGYFPQIYHNSHEQVSYQGDPTLTVMPRFSAKYLLTDHMRVKASLGRYVQFLNIVPLGDGNMSIIDIWFPNDGSLPPSEAYHYVAGLEGDLTPALSWSVETYYKTMPRLYRLDMTAVRVQKGSDLFHAGSGWAAGADFYLEKSRGDFTGWLSYSLGWTKRKFAAIDDGREFYPKFDRRHNVKMVGTYRFSDRWSTNVAWTYGTGQGYTRPLGQYQLRYPDHQESFVVGGHRNNARLPAYHRLDVGIRYSRVMPESKWLREWSWYLQLFNAYNRRNLWHKNVSFSDNGTAKVTEVRMLPILPTLGIEIAF